VYVAFAHEKALGIFALCSYLSSYTGYTYMVYVYLLISKERDMHMSG
jgi:hypothetical protein